MIAPSRREAKRLAEEAYGSRNVIRHDAHRPGYRDHFQPARRRGAQRTGHVFYGGPRNIVIALGGLGAAIASEVEAATESKTLGNIVEFGIDSINPAADIVTVEELLEEIGVDIIESYYEVDLDVEIEPDLYFDYEPIDLEAD